MKKLLIITIAMLMTSCGQRTVNKNKKETVTESVEKELGEKSDITVNQHSYYACRTFVVDDIKAVVNKCVDEFAEKPESCANEMEMWQQAYQGINCVALDEYNQEVQITDSHFQSLIELLRG